MLKTLSLLFSFFLGRLNSGGHHEALFSPDELIDKTLSKLRGLMSVVALGAVATIFLTAGFLGAYYNMLLQMDTTGKMGPNAVVVGGVCLFVAGLVIFAIASRSTASSRSHAKTQAQSSAKPDHGRAISALEEALSMLIIDHVKEREFSREIRRRHQSERSFYQERPSRADEATQTPVH